MKVPYSILIASAVAGLAGLSSPMVHAADKGYCWGTVSKDDGGCHGVVPKGVEGNVDKSWSCAGSAPFSSMAWEKGISKDECEAKAIHPEAKEDYAAAGLTKPVWSEKASHNPLYDNPKYVEHIKKKVAKS